MLFVDVLGYFIKYAYYFLDLEYDDTFQLTNKECDQKRYTDNAHCPPGTFQTGYPFWALSWTYRLK